MQNNLTGLFGVLIAVAALALLIVVPFLIANYKLYKKTGQAGWKIFIPIYSSMVFAKIGGKPSWYGVVSALGYSVQPRWFPHNIGLIVIGITYTLAFVLSILIAVGVAKNFGRSTAFGIFLLGILPIIGVLILGFGKSTYQLKPDVEQPPQLA